MRINNIKRTFLLWGCIAFIPLVLCYPQNKELKRVTFLPMWVPQSQFAGYYMAKEKGIYEKHGLDVTILTGGDSHDVKASLKNGEATFGTMFLYTGVMERAKGTKLVNIGQIFQRSAIMFVAKKQSGVQTLQDFNGKKIGVWRTVERELTAGFLNKHHVKAEIIPFNNAINIFLEGAVDITVMMNYNEYKRMINAGINPDEVTTFRFSDFGMDFPEDGIYCMQGTFDRDPKLCREFVNASIEGWAYALANTDETLAVINRLKADAKISSNRSHSLWMLNQMKDMIHPAGKSTREGTLLKSDFESLTSFLYENAFITTKPLYEDFYKDIR